jgi:hypothetical protein
MTKQERINEWEKKIKRIVKDYKNLTACCDACFDAGVLDIDGNLYNAIFKTHDSLLEMIDKFNWISWYLYENNCGAEKMQAGYDDKLSKITTPKQLAKLIVESEDRYNVSIEQ